MQSYRLLINGALVAGDMVMPVINPATEEMVAQSPRASEVQLAEAIAAAKKAFKSWSALPISERCAVSAKIADVIDENREELARLLTLEQGKPLAEAIAETRGMANQFRYCSTLDLPVVILEDTPQRYVEVHRRPLGVVAAIAPWNYPLSILALKIAPALVTGNTVVAKPAPTTPLSTLRFAELIADLLPPGVLNVVTDANDLGGKLTNHPDIRVVTFTGSTATGKKVMASAADALTRIVLELGGNDAAIVLAGADPKEVSARLYQGAFLNSGQVCLAIKRVYVHESIYDDVCEELAALANNAVVDDGLKQGTTHGPVQNKAQFDRVKEIIEDARKYGNIIAGGTALQRSGYFIQPTIVRDIDETSRLVQEEQFGPVLPVMKFSELDEVVDKANDTTFGLAASIWAADADEAYAVASRMEAGTVWINKHMDQLPYIPFSGAKESGVGIAKGREGLDAFTQLQVINR